MAKSCWLASLVVGFQYPKKNFLPIDEQCWIEKSGKTAGGVDFPDVGFDTLEVGLASLNIHAMTCGFSVCQSCHPQTSLGIGKRRGKSSWGERLMFIDVPDCAGIIRLYWKKKHIYGCCI